MLEISSSKKAERDFLKEYPQYRRRFRVLKAAKSASNFNSLLSKLPNEKESYIRRTLTTSRNYGVMVPVLKGEIRSKNN